MEEKVEKWNEIHPVGESVIIIKDDKSLFKTETTSEAYVLSGHTPVVHVKGISGCYLLDRVRPAYEIEATND